MDKRLFRNKVREKIQGRLNDLISSSGPKAFRSFHQTMSAWSGNLASRMDIVFMPPCLFEFVVFMLFWCEIAMITDDHSLLELH